MSLGEKIWKGEDKKREDVKERKRKKGEEKDKRGSKRVK
jgi:hypothetical protein